jgi:DNA-binding MarR family transcriptional regulator
MQVVVDALVAPLNNWSDELIKFKIAAYPGRIYYGQIDKTKIDEINLDIFSMYGTSDIGGMEDKAIDFTRRLLQRRLGEFGAGDPQDFLDLRRDDEIWRHLFYATMANPRNLGYLLHFLYESQLIYGRTVSLRSIGDAARRYYEEKIEAYFLMNRFLHESFEERSSIFSLRDLLDALVERARELRGHTGSSVMRELGGRPPTSHFHVVTGLDGLLSSLELNFFLTKYYVMSDRDGRKVTVFALNYGLCQKSSIEFGRPSGKREYRLYYVERIFDYTAILQEYLRTNQEIACDNASCGARFEFDQVEALRLFSMLCPECRAGTCVVSNLSRKYETTLRAIDDQLLLPRVELGILHTLGTEPRALYPAEIAGELDCSYQLVGKRARFLADRGLVNRGQSNQGRRELSLTDTARDIYFDAPDAED